MRELDLIRQALVVPLQGGPLMLMIVFSLLFWLASGAGLLGIPLALILLSWFFKYGFVVLDTLIAGRKEIPVFSIEMANPANEQRPLIYLLVVVVAFFFANASEYWFGPVISILVAGLLIVLLPAMLATQSVTGSIVQSLSPVRSVRLMQRMGKDYLLLLLAAVVLLLASSSAIAAFSLPTVIRVAAALYCWLALFAAVGIVVIAHRADLGFEDVEQPATDEVIASSQTAHHEERQRERMLDRVYAEWRGGSHRAAWHTVESFLADSSDPLVELRWMYERASKWPDQRLAERLAQVLLSRLLQTRSNSEAFRIIQERMRHNRTFRPTTSNELLALVRLARDGGDRATARALLTNFDQAYPNDPLQQAAMQLAEQLQR